jgi:hypothetical protein
MIMWPTNENGDVDYQDTLSENETVIASRPFGVRLLGIEESTGETEYRFEAPGQPDLVFYEEYRALLFIDLHTALDSFTIEKVGTKGIPSQVAIAGKPYIAAYLVAKWGDRPQTAASRLGVEKQVVYNYISKVRDRAEEELQRQRELEAEKKHGTKE